MDSAARRAETRRGDGQVKRPSVVVIGRRMFCDLVRRLLAEYEIDVVEAERGTPFERAVEEADARFLIVGNGDGRVGSACTELLETHPDVRALAVLDHGRRGVLFEMLDNLTPETLASAVRARPRGGY
jgi:hypothetical protein